MKRSEPGPPGDTRQCRRGARSPYRLVQGLQPLGRARSRGASAALRCGDQRSRLACATAMLQMRERRNRYGRYGNRATHGLLTAARSAFPAVLCPRLPDRLPLHVRNRVRSPHASGTLWSLRYPGHAPVVSPVEGQGCSRWNSRVTSRDRCSLAATGVDRTATIIAATIAPALTTGSSANTRLLPTYVRRDRTGNIARTLLLACSRYVRAWLIRG
jgi:hypothetical protein